MYNFIDTTEVSEVALLPSEALRINGQYIENLIQGYRTLNVTGREALSAELDYFETGVRDGSQMKSKRYPARIITVTYQLIAQSSEAFREAYNQLGRILNVEDAELIFNDEKDKFYIGTPETIGEVPPGRNAVTGEFEILCLNPFKYSVVEYEATASLDTKSVLIDYKGTYKGYPTLEADFYEEVENGETEVALTRNGDCGFVAFFDENENIIQLGNPEEVDGSKVSASQNLMNQTFLSNTAWGTTAKKLWAVNSGSVAMKTADVTDKCYLGASSYGTGSGWHGASITRQVGEDAAGIVGATHFQFQSRIVLGISKKNQVGNFEVKLQDASGKNVAGIRIYKNKAGKTGSLVFYVNGKSLNMTNLDIPSAKMFNFYIRKNGSNVQFNFNSYMRHFTDASLANVAVTKVTFCFEQWGTNTPMAINGVQTAKFTKNNCDTFADIPNKFSASDIVKADCKDGKVYLNGIESPELGALGNDWEGFCLTPGVNQIGFTYSDWLTDQYAPTIKVRYREVYL